MTMTGSCANDSFLYYPDFNPHIFTFFMTLSRSSDSDHNAVSIHHRCPTTGDVSLSVISGLGLVELCASQIIGCLTHNPAYIRAVFLGAFLSSLASRDA